jgi:transposase
VRGTRVWARLLDVKGAVVEDVYCGDEGEVVVAVRPRWRERDRCGVCRRRCPGFDLGEGRRRWRALDLGTTFAYVEADAPRASCREHGVVVCAVPRGAPSVALHPRVRRRDGVAGGGLLEVGGRAVDADQLADGRRDL